MMKLNRNHTARLIGIIAGLFVFALTSGVALAGPQAQGEEPPPAPEGTNCKQCHLDVASHWEVSPHAHAYDDPVFQERWLGLGEPGECLVCHTTNYLDTTGEYTTEGVDCEACHGLAGEDHPPAVVSIEANTELCGTCHHTTLGEWRLTGHSSSDVGCMDCHDPHSQQPLFENADDLCINCHKEDMERYLEDLHVQKGIGCVDCHALVIPPEEIPEDGIVPTGHTFTITPATCVACHTDALHAGFSLPGYEAGAKAGNVETGISDSVLLSEATNAASSTPDQQTAQAIQAASSSRTMSIIFQGGIVGLVLGSTTAWIIANNVRGASSEQDE